jgi:hypothetical protein
MAIRHTFVSAKADGADTTVVQPGDWNADHVVDGDPGVQYVKASGGNDSNNGRSWDTAKATIQAAVDALPNNSPTGIWGGTIYLGAGWYNSEPVEITKPGVFIVGASEMATKISVAAGHGYAFHWNGNFIGGGARNIRIVSGSSTTSHGGILVDTTEKLIFENLVFQSFGGGVAQSTSFDVDAGPYGSKIRGDNSAAFADWITFLNCEWFACYRGFVNAGGGAGATILGGFMRDMRHEAVYCKRQVRAGGGGGSAAAAGADIIGVYMKATFGTVGNYLIRIENDPAMGSNNDTDAEILGCKTEVISSDTGHHILLDAGGNYVIGHKFLNGAAEGGGTADAVFFGANSDNNVIGPHLLSGNPKQFRAANSTIATASGNVVWQPSDYTRTIVV